MRDSVVTQLVWPHTRLEYAYVSSDLPYGKLDLALLVAGELAVIQAVGTAEREGRTRLLQRLMYFSKDYTWQATRNLHEAALLEVERGVRQWNNPDYRDLEASILYRHPLVTTAVIRQPSTQSAQYTVQPTKKYFCLEYNRDSCSHTGSHEARVGAVIQTVDHFCATCWMRDRAIRDHREIAVSCPYHK